MAFSLLPVRRAVATMPRQSDVKILAGSCVWVQWSPMQEKQGSPVANYDSNLRQSVSEKCRKINSVKYMGLSAGERGNSTKFRWIIGDDAR